MKLTKEQADDLYDRAVDSVANGLRALATDVPTARSTPGELLDLAASAVDEALGADSEATGAYCERVADAALRGAGVIR